MEAAVAASIISGSVAAFAAVLSITGQYRMKRMEADLALQKAEADRRAETARTARKYGEPLGRAAYDLQSRIYNIIKSDFLNAYLKNGDRRTRLYAIRNTLFVIAQYFAWTELVRREIQFIDLGADEQTRKLTELQDSIYSIWQTNAYGDPLFRIFAGERAPSENVSFAKARAGRNAWAMLLFWTFASSTRTRCFAPWRPMSLPWALTFGKHFRG